MEGGDGAAASIPGQVDPAPSTGAGNDGEISTVQTVENGSSERGGGVGVGKDGATLKTTQSQIIGGRELLPIGRQAPGHKSAGNLSAYNVDDITPDPSIPDLLNRVGKFGQTERRSSRECPSPWPAKLRDRRRQPQGRQGRTISLCATSFDDAPWPPPVHWKVADATDVEKRRES